MFRFRESDDVKPKVAQRPDPCTRPRQQRKRNEQARIRRSKSFQASLKPADIM
jgi:hypothetical protein